MNASDLILNGAARNAAAAPWHGNNNNMGQSCYKQLAL
jgi:hypothetical protein